MRTSKAARARAGGFTFVELLVVIAMIALLIALLLPAVQTARETARRTSCCNNLMQLGLGIASYASTHAVLPPGVVNETGPIQNLPSGYHHSWVVQILPFIDQVNLFNHINLRQGAYDAANDTVAVMKVPTLVCPADGHRSSYFMNYAGCHNDTNSAIDLRDRGVLYLNSRVRYDEITDGRSQTILLGEILNGSSMGWISGTRATLRNTGVPLGARSWGIDPILSRSPHLQPAFQPNRPRDELFGAIEFLVDDGTWPVDLPGGFASVHPTTCNFLFCDGSVRQVSRMIDQRVLKLLGARADGELIDSDAF